VPSGVALDSEGRRGYHLRSAHVADEPGEKHWCKASTYGDSEET